MKQLLMIDDDEKLVSLMREYLEPHGFEVAAAYDGLAGVEMALATRPALVILDLMLPEIDGLEVCRRLRQSSRVPILMLTARGDETDRIVGLEMGADDYLAKPFNARELLARIRAILRRVDDGESVDRSVTMQAGTPRRGALRVGPLGVDPGSRTITVCGRSVDLTTVEFDILHALARNAGHVLSRDQLLQEVHGPGWAAYDRSVDVHISRIRQKIERDPKKPELLKTVRGIGYQLSRAEEP